MKRIPKNLTKQQKTARSIQNTQEDRDIFKSVLRWENRQEGVYPDLQSFFRGWYLWIYFSSSTKFAVIIVYENQEKKDETDPDFVEFLLSIPDKVSSSIDRKYQIKFHEGNEEIEVSVKYFLPYLCYPYNLKKDINLWKFAAHWIADTQRAENFMNNLIFCDVKAIFPNTRTLCDDNKKTATEWNEKFANRPAYEENVVVTLEEMWDSGDLAWAPIPEKKYIHSRKGYDLNLIIIDQMKVNQDVV
jgi:hypothetical protein